MALVVCAGSLIWAMGCESSRHRPGLVLPGGPIERTHSKPMEGGYYEDFDPDAASIEIEPATDVNPVRTQHVLIATVRDKQGKPLPGRRVEWMISDGVGTIVEVDESGWLADRGHKVTGRYAITHTNDLDHLITRGNQDPSDDFHLKKGQTWCVITSPVEGTTHVVAYAPGIFNWDQHKVFAQKHWYDVDWQLPPPAVNPMGTPHVLSTRVTRHSDGSPLAGYIVTYTIQGGPPATLEPGNQQTVSVRTDAQGVAAVTLQQAKPVEGVNPIRVQVQRPADVQCCKPAVDLVTAVTTKTWVGPKIAIDKTAPARAMVNETFGYSIAVRNPGQVPATGVVVKDVLPEGIAYVSSQPAAKAAGQDLTWELGELPAGASKEIAVTVKGTRTGTFENCATVAAAYGLSGRACAKTVIWAPGLTLKKAGPATVIRCDPIVFRLTVANPGDGPATNVRVTDMMPAGLTTVDGRSSVALELGTLQAGESRTVDVAAKAARAGTFINQAVATANHGLKAGAECQVVVQEPELVVTKSGPKSRFINRPFDYEITVANKGSAPARDTILVDTLPAGVKVVSASSGGSLADGKVTWNLGTLEPGAAKKVTLTVVGTGKGVIRNTAQATAYCAAAAAEAQTAIEGIAAVLLEVIDLDDPVEVGAQTTYEIVVTNQGSADGTNVVVTCTLPPQEACVSASGPTPVTVADKVITFAPLPSLAPQAKATYRVVVKGLAAGDVRFKATLKTDQMATPAEETESTHIY